MSKDTNGGSEVSCGFEAKNSPESVYRDRMPHCICACLCVPCVPGCVRMCHACSVCIVRAQVIGMRAGDAINNRTSQPIVIASVKVAAPVGRIMNSCIASLLPACDPPLITLKDGTGKTRSSLPARSA